MGDIPETTCSTEARERFRNCINIPNRQTEKLNEQVERNRVLEEENKNLKKSLKHKDLEIAKLLLQLVSKETRSDSLEEWMKRQIEEVRLSTDKLNENIMEVYTRIMEKRTAKSQSTTSSDRKKLYEEIQKMENICEDISKEIIENNQKATEKITSQLQQKPKEKLVVANSQIKPFLGSYAYKSLSGNIWYITIQLDAATGFFHCYNSLLEHSFDDLLLPDGVEQNGIRATIEGTRLTIEDCDLSTYIYELREDNLEYRNHLYVREQ